MSCHPLSRRDFFSFAGKCSLAVAGACAAASSPPWVKKALHISSDLYAAEALDKLIANAPVARYWVSSETEGDHCADCHSAEQIPASHSHSHKAPIIKCLLCAQGCLIHDGKRGGCNARMNVDGQLRSLVYGRPVSIHVDPIEKKPFYHFLPRSQAYSLATSGCPLHCQFCQNWEISQMHPEDYDVPFTPPDRIAQAASEQDVPVIAFTYNEPTVFTEYLTDIARAAKERGIRCVLVSCGFMTEAPLTEMCSVLDAVKIDLKGFSENFYHRVCSAELKPVLRSIRQVSRSGVHLEIVNLVVPTLNDSNTMLANLCDWIVGELGPDVPIHFTRFHPDYKLYNLAPTPVATLDLARETALAKGIHFPYVGNVPGHAGNNTYCPKCGQVIIARSSFFVTAYHITHGACEFCGEKIPGVWS